MQGMYCPEKDFIGVDVDITSAFLSIFCSIMNEITLHLAPVYS